MKNIINALKAATLNKIDTVTALRAIEQRAQGNTINVAAITAIAGTMSPLVKLTQVTDVKLAAAHKKRNIVKMAHTVCIIPENAEVYTSSITHTASQNADNNADDIAAYKPRESKYDHNPAAFAACTLKSNSENHYLYTIQDKCSKSILIDADTKQIISKEEVAELMTPSEAKKLLGKSEEKVNKAFNIEHDVVVRIIKQENVISMEKVDF